MLTKIDFRTSTVDPIVALIAGMEGQLPKITTIIDGVYLGYLNCEQSIPRVKNNYPVFYLTPDGETDYYNFFGSYGVCDSYEQILEKCPVIVDSDRKFVITLSKITRKSQPSYGGWRWHKWGTYIGTKEPQHEYLYDETDIDEVYLYHITEVD